MRLTDKQINRLVKMVFKELESRGAITYKVDQPKVFSRAVELIKAEYAAERKLDEEVNKMLDEIERQSPDEIQRFKMFPLLKKKLAAQRKVII